MVKLLEFTATLPGVEEDLEPTKSEKKEASSEHLQKQDEGKVEVEGKCASSGENLAIKSEDTDSSGSINSAPTQENPASSEEASMAAIQSVCFCCEIYVYIDIYYMFMTYVRVSNGECWTFLATKEYNCHSTSSYSLSLLKRHPTHTIYLFL
tara:strand:+ start:412 stop:867 length:456 start_codon:yes stop_codon:yes gene_type:complete